MGTLLTVNDCFHHRLKLAFASASTTANVFQFIYSLYCPVYERYQLDLRKCRAALSSPMISRLI
jgi:hypothetical protein